ncbi:Helicase associated domain protein (plasmid) [Streptomyces sp. R39]|uniref:Helicase associated domain protein n=1 Tax=Streptomyces sp. R39 TaxID=3238631 RepID=A0AB39R266_9ACTN
MTRAQPAEGDGASPRYVLPRQGLSIDNKVSDSTLYGPSIQAGRIHLGVHFHEAAPSDPPFPPTAAVARQPRRPGCSQGRLLTRWQAQALSCSTTSCPRTASPARASLTLRGRTAAAQPHHCTEVHRVSPISTAPALWPHQREAVSAATAALQGAARTTVVMACGTGKTRVESEVADAIAPDGLVVVVLPTLALVEQTLRSWLQTSGPDALGLIISVCSDEEVLDRDSAEGLNSLRVHVTTDPSQLAELLVSRPQGRCTVAVTYASLPIVAAAQRRPNVPTSRLIVVDEAHRSAGGRDGTWSIVHDDGQLPAEKRLYMTATPRMVLPRGDSSTEVFSMDDETVYGRVAYRLGFAAARSRGLLADYRVVVALVSDDEVRTLANGENRAQFLGVGKAAVSAPVLARQIAVLRAASEFGIQRLLTYHHRVKDALWYAKTLPAVDSLLSPTPGTPDLVTGCVHGGQDRAERKAVLDHLRRDGSRRVIISNARVLSEGYDAPSVDGIAFISPRDSPIDTIQAVGRALRLGGKKEKMAYVVIPVLLDPGQDPVSALEGSAYAPVWRVVQALAAHDESIAARLKASRAVLGRSHDGGSDLAETPEWLAFSGVPVPPAFAAAITAHAIRSATESWEEFFGAAQEYHDKTGNLDVPSDFVTETGLSLGRWVSEQRSQQKKGNLREDRRERLENLGITWDLREAVWQQYLAAAKEYHNKQGHLRVPVDFSSSGPNPVKLGWFLLRVRTQAQPLSDTQRAELDKIGMVWDTKNDHYWDRMTAAAKAYRAKHGDLLVPSGHVTSDDPPLQLGKWIARCRSWRKDNHETLTPERIQYLDRLGMVWDARAQVWWSAFQAARAYFQEHGNLAVPSTYKTAEPDPFKLGSWIQKQRKKYKAETLTAEQVTALDEIGMEWSVRPSARRCDST